MFEDSCNIATPIREGRARRGVSNCLLVPTWTTRGLRRKLPPKLDTERSR